MKKIFKLVSMCFIIAAMLTTAALAAAPNDPIEPQASKYISGTTVAIGAMGNGKIKVTFSITATGTMKEVGAHWVKIYNEDTGECVESYYYKDDDYKYMMAYNTGSHTASVTYNGESGQRYGAKVTFYAGESGVAGGTRTVGSAIITA